MKAYKVEVIQSSIPDNETIEGTDPSIYFPPPTSIHQKIRLKDEVAKNGWFKTVRKEVTQFVISGTFHITVKPNPGETTIDVMKTKKIKVNKDIMLDKLKTCLCVRGDIQKNKCSDMEDSNSPEESFRMLKLLLAHALAKKARAYQGYVIGVFLQAKRRSRLFVKLHKICGELFPEFSEYFGVPMLLCNAMYGMTFVTV